MVGMAAGVMGVAGAFTGYMASMEATENANNQAWAQYLNQDHQARLAIQRENQASKSCNPTSQRSGFWE